MRGRVFIENVETVEKEITTESTNGFKVTLHTSGRIDFDRNLPDDLDVVAGRRPFAGEP